MEYAYAVKIVLGPIPKSWTPPFRVLKSVRHLEYSEYRNFSVRYGPGC